MKRYYVKYYLNFSNTYNLAYAETEAEEKQAKEQGYERITRKEAERLCAQENQRRKDDPAFAYSADTVILPIGYDDDWRNDRHMALDGYIVERRNK